MVTGLRSVAPIARKYVLNFGAAFPGDIDESELGLHDALLLGRPSGNWPPFVRKLLRKYRRRAVPCETTGEKVDSRRKPQ